MIIFIVVLFLLYCCYLPDCDFTGRIILTVYLMSDSYLGLDQQYDLYLDVIPSNLKCQINTDLAGLSIESLDSIGPHEETGNEDVSQKW